MIEESYVSFGTAKMLREAGFDVPCATLYTSDGVEDYTSVPVNQNFGGDFSRPTQALAARWLREVHKIVVDASFIPPSTDGGDWRYSIGNNMGDMVWIGDYVSSDEYYGTYEQALEAGLQEALKLILKKDNEKGNKIDRNDLLPDVTKETDQEKCCGNCINFMFEDINGNGWCSENDDETTCGHTCTEWHRAKGTGSFLNASRRRNRNGV